MVENSNRRIVRGSARFTTQTSLLSIFYPKSAKLISKIKFRSDRGSLDSPFVVHRSTEPTRLPSSKQPPCLEASGTIRSLHLHSVSLGGAMSALSGQFKKNIFHDTVTSQFYC